VKLNRLNLIRRLAGIQDERAGEAVRTQRQMRDDADRQRNLLAGYRRGLSLTIGERNEHDGQALRARSAFIDVAEAACRDARRQLASSEAQLREALQRWSEARERTRVVADKYDHARRRALREQERQAEKELPAVRTRRDDLSG